MTEPPATRIQRRRKRNLEALIAAGYEIISLKGIDASTMGEIAEMADVGSGTVYNYFPSKDDLVVAVMERVMRRLTERIAAATGNFDDPAVLYAFGMYSMLRAMIDDHRWRGLCRRPEIISGAIFRIIGPLAIRDLVAATSMGRFNLTDPELVWRMTTHAIIGFALGVHNEAIQASAISEALVSLLGMAGFSPSDARVIVDRTWPELPPE